jgi:hypothetical protein
MGGYLILILKQLGYGPQTEIPATPADDSPERLPAFVFGDGGEFLGRVDVPVLTGAEKGN